MSGKKLPNKIADELVDYISKSYSLGDKIPNEMKLAAKFSVSRTTIREAIKILCSQDIIEVRRGKGTYVKKEIGVLRNPSGLKFVDDQGIVTDLLEFMRIIEPEATAKALKNHCEEDLTNLKRIHNEYENLLSMYRREDEDTGLIKLYEKDMEFRGFLVEMCDNKMMSKIFPLEITNYVTWYEKMIDSCSKYQENIITTLENNDEEGIRTVSLDYIDEIVAMLEDTSPCIA